MIGGISSSAVSVAAARFDRAAVAMTDAAAGDGSAGPDVGGVGDAMVAMAAAKFALLASFHAARMSNEMVDQMLGQFRADA